MKTKEELQQEIYIEINKAHKAMNAFGFSESSDATNRVAISNLYIALSNLIK